MIKELTIEKTSLPVGWEMKTLGEVCNIQNGFAYKSKSYVNSGYRVIRISNVQNGQIIDKSPRYINESLAKEKEQFIIKKGDILTSLTGDVGRVGVFPEKMLPAVLNQRVGRFFNIQFSIIDTKYLLLFLKSTKFEEEVILGATGAAQKNTSTKKILEVKIPLPSIRQQNQIVVILDKAFAAIDTAKANAQQNLQNAKELFESYLKNVFENKGDDWEEKKWGELCHFVRGPFGGSLKKSMFKESGYVVYEQKHAIHDHFNQLRYFIDEEKFNEMKRFEVKPGDIIMSCSGVTLGRVAIIPDNIPQGIINQALLKLTPNKEINVEFLKHWLRSNIFQTIIFEHSGGAAIPNVPSAKILKEIIIPIPNIKEQKRIVSEIELMLNQTKKLESIYSQKLADLEEMKKSVLQKAFSGQLNTIN